VDTKVAAKRELDYSSSPTAKKPRIDDKKSTFSSLLKRVNPNSPASTAKLSGSGADSPEGSKSSADSSKFKLGDLTKKGNLDLFNRVFGVQLAAPHSVISCISCCEEETFEKG
jgi:hypothetical protein